MFEWDKWGCKGLYVITYCVVYCTFYVRKLISSSVDEENVVKRIIIKNDWIIFLFEREYLEIFNRTKKKKEKTKT